METSQNIDQLATALAAAQAVIQNPTKDRVNPHFRSRYADLAGGLDVVRPALSKHGLAVIQATEWTGDAMVLRTRLAHSSGQWIESVYPVSGFDNHQKMGSALTYARRYALFAMVGIAAEDDDSDGEGAAEPKRQAKPSASVAEARAYYDVCIDWIDAAEDDEELAKWWVAEKRNRDLHWPNGNETALLALRERVRVKGTALSALKTAADNRAEMEPAQ